MARSRASSIVQASVVALTFTTSAGPFVATAASPLHGHQHGREQRHHQGRSHHIKRVVNVVEVPGPTAYAFEFNGKPLDQSNVCEGILAGSLKWADETNNPPQCSSSMLPSSLLPTNTVHQPSPSSSSEPWTSLTIPGIQGVSTQQAVSSQVGNLGMSRAVESQSLPTSLSENASATNYNPDFDKWALQLTSRTTSVFPKPTSSGLPPKPSAKLMNTLAAFHQNPTPSTLSISQSYTSSAYISSESEVQSQTFSSSYGSNFSGGGLDREFPDSEIDCTNFPSDFGPIELDWVGLKGWSGIQYPVIQNGEITDIVTAVPGQGCVPGALCSYACPPGYQKSQWPSTQGSGGQSVGGLSCNSNGKLALTNPGLSKRLCIPGTGAVMVQNRLSENAAICRTDYPGTENEVVPLNTQPGSTNPLTCPDAASYFAWQDSPTSAQYYINNQGVPLEDACIWNKDGSHEGNFAPSCLGVGQDAHGRTFCSILTTADNKPISYAPLNFSIRIAGDISGSCALIQGRYCSGQNFEDCNDSGCTVEILSGQATYILEDHFLSGSA